MPLLKLENIQKQYKRGNGPIVHAVNGVSLHVDHGETLAVIGESGSGKSTIGRIALGLVDPSAGTVEFDGHRLDTMSGKELRRLRPSMQTVFQEPFQSLNPRRTVGDTITEPLIIHRMASSRADLRERLKQTLDQVGLPHELADRYPQALSGGQQQRVGIARAIVTRPKLIVLDEPTSSLDLSVRAQILNLLGDLRDKHSLSYLFISHDIATVRHISQRVAVMYLGQVVEIGPVADVMDRPQHPYTRALLSATLSPDPDISPPPYEPLQGELPDPTELPSGCFLFSRCALATPECAAAPVPLHSVDSEHEVACIKVPERISVFR
jgi:oligopeptide/dipeptide ABC transporter ATP-binding protein